MNGTNRNDDFVYLAVAPIIAALAFFVFYVQGWIPAVPVPQFAVPWAAQLDNLRTAASANQASAVAIGVAILVGLIGVTWVVMVVLDLKRGLYAFVRWILRRPPRHVSGLLRSEQKPEWSVHMASVDEPIKTYKAKSGGFTSDRFQ